MILRCVYWSIFLHLVLGTAVKAQVTVDEKGYQNILISFAPNVPFEYGIENLENIQNLLESTSKVLYKAIGIPMANVTFLLPSSWPTETWKNININPASPFQSARRPDIRIDETEDSPFKNQPVALQHGGCGVPGYQIILNLKSMGVFPKYPEGKLLAREWLKYRYGVFEENGYLKDKLYPAYYRAPGKSDIRITECTDSKVTYIFREPLIRDVCVMNTLSLFDFCKTQPDEKSAANVTSSLMYFHEDLPKMEHICGKDGLPHNSLARNKQNSLCNGRSIWDVVKSSDDFKNIQHQPSNPIPKPIKFSYIQEKNPRFVVLLEDSDNLHEKGSAILFALRQFYYDLPAKSKLAIYTYNNDVIEIFPNTELRAETRKDLGAIADFGSPAKKPCVSCGLEWAAPLLVEDGGGSLLLITSSPLDKVPDDLSVKLRESGICLHVLRITSEKNPYDSSYDRLAKSFYCFSQHSLPISLDNESILEASSRILMNLVPKFDNFEIKTVTSKNMSALNLLTINRDTTAELYTLWMGKALGKDSIKCKAGDTDVDLKPNTKATDVASFTFTPVDKDITCQLSSTKQTPVPSQVRMRTQKGQFFNFDIWIHDESTDKEQMPIIIYAKIYFGEYPVNKARVTALIKSGNKQTSVVLVDNGLGDTDVTESDGIYSGFFTDFLEAGIYEIIVKATDNKGKAKIGKYRKQLEPDTCCGSQVLTDNFDVPAFEMEKITSYTAKNKRPKTGYSPSKILDLVVPIFGTGDKKLLTWTAPWGGKAVRYVIKLFESREDAIQRFETSGMELNASRQVPKEPGTKEGFVIYLKNLDENVTYYAAIRSFNEFNKPSEISNLAEFVVKDYVEPTVETTPESSTVTGSTIDDRNNVTDPPKNSGKTVGIVLGVLGGIAVLCGLAYLGYYFYVKKQRRH